MSNQDKPQPAPVAAMTGDELRPEDLRIETYSPTPRPQWVAHNDRGIRITHVPTGATVECCEDQSQHRNRALAMERLRAILAAQQPAADSRATGNDGEMPPLPWKGDYDAWYAKNKFHMHEAFEKYARTYGQQCRDAALERAEGICLKSSNEYLSHEELADAIRALKGGK